MTKKAGADSARRAVNLLFAFENQPVATVRRLAEQLDVPVPSTHRYIAMLRDMGLVEEARHGEYRLTMRVAALGQAARKGTTVLEVVQPFMQSLHEETGETVLLNQPIGNVPVCIHRLETQQRIRLSFEIGQPLPALRGASAHLMLAAMPEDERRGFVDEHIARGARPPASGVEEFLLEVKRDAERGWTVSAEEIDEGVWAAAAVISSGGKFFGTLVVPCPAYRVDDELSTRIVESVRTTAHELSRAIGSVI